MPERWGTSIFWRGGIFVSVVWKMMVMMVCERKESRYQVRYLHSSKRKQKVSLII